MKSVGWLYIQSVCWCCHYASPARVETRRSLIICIIVIIVLSLVNLQIIKNARHMYSNKKKLYIQWYVDSWWWVLYLFKTCRVQNFRINTYDRVYLVVLFIQLITMHGLYNIKKNKRYITPNEAHPTLLFVRRVVFCY